MPVVINNQTYYRTAEVCRIVGISRNTLFRWLKEGVFSDVEYRDWRGWRLFTAAQLEVLRTKTNHVIATNRRSQGSMQMEKTL
jgi:predicted site-specific integrase-resolvase